MKKLVALLVYVTICGRPDQVDATVNQYLADGYKLYGNQSGIVYAYQLSICQAMTKDAKPPAVRHWKRHVAHGAFK